MISTVYTDEQLARLHKVETDILLEKIRVCEDNDISYFTASGTTLGAIRYGGFIPWDDDVDIGMLRKDYDRFLKLAPTALAPQYSLQHFENEKNMPTYFAKVRKNGTEFVEEHLKNIKMNHGIYVDVFPFDYVPEDIKERNKNHKKIKVLEQLYISKRLWRASSFYRDNKRIPLTLVRSILHVCLLPVPRKYLYNKLDKQCRKYNSSETPMVAFRGSPISQCYVKDLFPLRTVPFEDIMVKVPNNTDTILKTIYGDYMQLPPVEKRVGHSPCKLKF